MTISAIAFRGTLTQSEKLQNSEEACAVSVSAPADRFTFSGKAKNIRFGGLQADTLKAQKEAHLLHLLNNQLKPTFAEFSVSQVGHELDDQTDISVTLQIDKSRTQETDQYFQLYAFVAPGKSTGQSAEESDKPKNTVLYQLARTTDLKKAYGSETSYGHYTVISYELTPDGKPVTRYQNYTIEKPYGQNRSSRLAKELVSETQEATDTAKTFFEGLASRVREKVGQNADDLVYRVEDLAL